MALKGNKHGKQFTKDYQPTNRRKPDTLAMALRELMATGDNMQAVANVLLAEALGGNIRAIQLIFERLEGKLPDIVTTTTITTPQIIYLPADTSTPPVTDESQVIDPLDGK